MERNSLMALAPIALVIASTVLGTCAFAQGSHGGGHGSSGGHAQGGHTGAAAAPHFAARPSYGAGGYAGYVTHGGYVAHAGYAAHHGGNFAAPVRVGSYAPLARGNFTAGGARYVPGRYGSGAGFGHGRWNGGYWHGGFWPGVYWGANYAWFLPVLPAWCATYWWNSVPYYYYNDVYYTYDPSASGYVVTTPPPAQDPNAQYPNGQDPNAPPPTDNAAPNAADSGTSGGRASSGGLFAYPKNGQSDDQQAADKQECASWAAGQTGADGTGTSMDYQRAMTACLQGRGYSVD